MAVPQNQSYIPQGYQSVGVFQSNAPVVGTTNVTGQVATAPGQQVGFEDVVVRVPTRQQVQTVVIPGPVQTVHVPGPPRVVDRVVKVQGPPKVRVERVQGPPRTVVKRVQVQGPEQIRKRQVRVQGPPRTVVRRVEVAGAPREVIKKVEVQGPPREVIKRIEIPGPPQEKVVKVRVAVPGPATTEEKIVKVDKPVVRQVVKTVEVDQYVPVPVRVPGPPQEVVVVVDDKKLQWENEMLSREIEDLKAAHENQGNIEELRNEIRLLQQKLWKQQMMGGGQSNFQLGQHQYTPGATLKFSGYTRIGEIERQLGQQQQGAFGGGFQQQGFGGFQQQGFGGAYPQQGFGGGFNTYN